jgi:hypothetical protein
MVHLLPLGGGGGGADQSNNNNNNTTANSMNNNSATAHKTIPVCKSPIFFYFLIFFFHLHLIEMKLCCRPLINTHFYSPAVFQPMSDETLPVGWVPQDRHQSISF